MKITKEQADQIRVEATKLLRIELKNMKTDLFIPLIDGLISRIDRFSMTKDQMRLFVVAFESRAALTFVGMENIATMPVQPADRPQITDLLSTFAMEHWVSSLVLKTALAILFPSKP